MTASRFGIWAKRSTRRVLVGITAICCVGMMLVNIEESPAQAMVALVLSIVSLASLALLLMPRVIGTSYGNDKMLDERQLQIRNRAYLQAYRFLAVTLMMFNLYLYFAEPRGWWVPQFQNQPAFWALIVFILSLPPAVLAWLEPEPIGE